MCPIAAAGPVPKNAKNVLMLVVDDWRTEIKSLYGRNYIHSPNIDAFMGTAVGFKKAYVQQAICGATRASFLVRTDLRATPCRRCILIHCFGPRQ